MNLFNNQPWYVGGLHFQCMGCGNCCSGPDEGYIWVKPEEIELIADFLDISVKDFKNRYTRRVGLRTTILEDKKTKDCIFLNEDKGCDIYPVRPNQCRTWPFWDANLKNSDRWNYAANVCPGINRGKLYTVNEIEEIKNSKWWLDVQRSETSK